MQEAPYFCGESDGTADAQSAFRSTQFGSAGPSRWPAFDQLCLRGEDGRLFTRVHVLFENTKHTTCEHGATEVDADEAPINTMNRTTKRNAKENSEDKEEEEEEHGHTHTHTHRHIHRT